MVAGDMVFAVRIGAFTPGRAYRSARSLVFSNAVSPIHSADQAPAIFIICGIFTATSILALFLAGIVRLPIVDEIVLIILVSVPALSLAVRASMQ